MADDRGLACRRCGCRHLEVRDTIRERDGIRRYRVCRNCGSVLTTREIPIGGPKRIRPEN